MGCHKKAALFKKSMSQLNKIKIKSFQLANKVEVENIVLSYQTFGKAIGSAPLVVVNHALTGNSQVTEKEGWWNSLIGEEKVGIVELPTMSNTVEVISATEKLFESI